MRVTLRAESHEGQQYILKEWTTNSFLSDEEISGIETEVKLQL